MCGSVRDGETEGGGGERERERVLKAKRGQRTTHFLSLSWSMYSLS